MTEILPAVARWRRGWNGSRRCGYDLAPWQSPWERECLDLGDGERGGDWRIVTKDGRTLLGAGTMAHLSRHFWRDWLWPLMASCPRGLT
jgi:hypothetical protein